MPKIIGEVRDVEQVPAFTDRKTGEVIRDSFPRLYVLEGREVYKINAEGRRYAGPLPKVGEHIAADIEVRCYVSKGNAELVMDLLRYQTTGQAQQKAA